MAVVRNNKYVIANLSKIEKILEKLEKSQRKTVNKSS